MKFQVQHIELHQAGVLNPLVSDYLKQTPSLRPFYSHFPDEKGFEQALKQADYTYLDREKLFHILQVQAKRVKNTSIETERNLDLLKQKNTFTITTGHQLCLFTGPLYFIYKIISTINLAETLSKKFPQFAFVPVYWMAGEDHDFEEVNHFRVFGKTLRWETTQKGSVGDFDTESLVTVFELFKDVLGTSETAQSLSKLFSEAYLEHKNLCDATRHLVNVLFGKDGLLCVDGNEKEFKHQFKDVLEEDVFENSSATRVEESIKALSDLGYANQVNPRKINSFYTQKGIRARIEWDSKEYKILGTELKFSKEELKKKIREDAGIFSPNVVLRPLYQQRILPNLVYVGGPGELAYWLQYKALFAHYKIFFPLLLPRNFVTLIEKPVIDRLSKLKFTTQDSFLPEQHLVKMLVERSGMKPDLSEENQSLKTLFDGVLQKVTQIDKSLEPAVKAELQKASAGLQNLEGKMSKAIKQRSETEINQIKTIKQKLFPEDQPQERVENFTQFYLRYGNEFMTELKKALNPLDFKAILLLEN